jgi:hypothetical protein
MVWRVVWCGDQALKVAYSDLISLDHCKDALVVDLLEFSSDSHQWNVSFLKVAQDWEVDFFTLFFNFLYSLFWHDLWCEDTVLKDAFPIRFGIARVKDALVANNMEILGGSTKWNVSFVREARD